MNAIARRVSVRRAAVAVALAALWAGCGRAAARKVDEQAPQTLQATLDSGARPAFVGRDDRSDHLWKALQRFYRTTGHKPAWVSRGRPRWEAAELMQAIEDARQHGLDPDDYDLQPLAALRTEKSRNPFRKDALRPEQVVEADLRLTWTFLKFASHLHTGHVDPEAVDPHWFGRLRHVDLAAVLKHALDTGTVRASLEERAPQHPQYASLRQALNRLRDIATRGGWPTIPNGPALKKGARHPRVALLRQRLAASGDLPAAAGPADLFDAPLEAAVRSYQERHGIAGKGVVDAATLAALNIPVADRISQVELNLERWRWLPETLGTRYILVNVPTFQLQAFEGDRVVLAMRIVAGKKESPTPIFNDRMTYIVFSPYWNVPASILRDEMLPEILEDSSFVERMDLEVVEGSEVVDPGSIDWSEADADDVPYALRQRPGPRNSLGLVKFMFPNQFDVYLHDTPAQSLFARVGRDFSHGCVRVEKPRELALHLLRGQPEWTPERIDEAMQGGDEQVVKLKEPMPVYIVYSTAWTDAAGALHFAPDVYGHDVRQARVLKEHGAVRAALRQGAGARRPAGGG